MDDTILLYYIAMSLEAANAEREQIVIVTRSGKRGADSADLCSTALLKKEIKQCLV